MGNCVIHPIPLYTGKSDRTALLYRFECGQQFTSAGYVWYIEGAGQQILVDAGGSTEYIRNVLGRTSDDIQTIETGLGKFGLGCDDIELVIFTHLHHDHTAFASRFSKARFLVQRAELKFARNPHPLFAAIYPWKFVENIKFETISGDSNIADGVSVISTPGHTVGGQSVCVETAKGKAIITSMCTTMENFEPKLVGKNVPIIPPAPHCDVLKAYDSMIRIKEMADIIVPNHDAQYMNTVSIP